MTDRALTARSAGLAIAIATLLVTIVGAVLARVFDPDEFGSLGEALWWSVQTVTTVGYGDVAPRDVTGRVIGTVVMLAGIGFVTVVTAAVTATFIESTRRRMGREVADPIAEAIADITARLERIERRLDER